MAGVHASSLLVIMVMVLSIRNGIAKTSKIVDGLLGSAAVQKAAVEKGIEVAGKMVDKQLQIINEAQDKAEAFLDTGIKIDIVPQKGWARDDMFVPPGYHIGAKFTGGSSAPTGDGKKPFTYTGGVGNTLMNGCYGSSYQPNDPCHRLKVNATICRNMIDGAAFIGVGFDGRGSYSAESRKMSIVQRQCSNRKTYDSYSVPNTMNVHGIYDTIASMKTFEGRLEYQRYLQVEAGISVSYWGFSAGVKAAFGESQLSSLQAFMSMLNVDIYRYEIFMDEVRPEDLSVTFLKEFMNLPTSYYTPGSPIKYQNFIQRFGTHYIKSAVFGGRLQIRKTMDAEDVTNKKEFSVEMEAEMKMLFASGGAYSKTSGGTSSRNQTKTTSTSITAHGGSQEVAAVVAEVYAPTFKDEFKSWLKSIPDYPKAFRFLMGPITELVNFRADDLFPDEPSDWTCDGLASSLTTEVTQDGQERHYYIKDSNDTIPDSPTKVYCKFNSRQSLEDAISRRRSSLKRAVAVYLEEGVISPSAMQLPVCPDKRRDVALQDDILGKREVPSWSSITKEKIPINVVFDMQEDLSGFSRGEIHIPRNMTRAVRFARRKWFISDESGAFHLYNSYANGYSGNTDNRKVSINGLVLTFSEKEGNLVLGQYDYNVSKKVFPELGEYLIGQPLARVGWASKRPISKRSSSDVVAPCNVKWSNALRIDPTMKGGMCLHFTAATNGELFVVFSTIPGDTSTWYYVHIGTNRVAIYKGDERVSVTEETSALAVGDKILHQCYFVCIAETDTSTVLEYGKTLGSEDASEVHLNYIDIDHPLNVRFYTFGNGIDELRVMDAHIVSRNSTNAVCKGETYQDLITAMCVQRCHPLCEPLSGCRPTEEEPLSTECNACRYATVISSDASRTCVLECPPDTSPIGNKTCFETFSVEITEGNPNFNVSNLPRLNAMSVSFWIQLGIATAQYKEAKGRAFQWPMRFMAFQHKGLEYGYGDYNIRLVFNYYPTGLEPDGSPSASHELGGYVRFNKYSRSADFISSRQYNFNALPVVDGAWHHVCLTWFGPSGALRLYFDGVDVSLPDYNSRSAQGYLGGGGILQVGGHSHIWVPDSYNITDVNVWDRELLSSEVHANSQGCYGAKGNLKEWNDFKPSIESHDVNVLVPSMCPAEANSPSAPGVSTGGGKRDKVSPPQRKEKRRARQPK